MSLLNTLKEIKQENYDPYNDKVAKSTLLEAGTYPVRLKSVQAGENKFRDGEMQLAVVLEVVSGDRKGMTETTFLSFDESLPKFVLDKNGRLLLKLAAMTGVQFMESDLADEYTTAEALSKGIGKQFQLHLSITPNKKNPNYPYRNYELAPLEPVSDGLKMSSDEIEDDDLPF